MVEHGSYGRGDVGAIGRCHGDVERGRVKARTLTSVRHERLAHMFGRKGGSLTLSHSWLSKKMRHEESHGWM